MDKSKHQFADSSIVVHHKGAHLSSWVYQGKEQLFLSRNAVFEANKAIRGGVPICFPQFGAFGSGSSHGFARNVMWRKLATQAANALQFELTHDEPTVKQHPYEFNYQFKALFTVELIENSLLISLSVTNLSDKEMNFTAALHTYFHVDDINNVLVEGLAGAEFWDNGTDFNQRNHQEQTELSVNGAIDRVYFNTRNPLLLTEGALKRKITANGFADTVVWNPGREGAQKFADMADDEYLKMLCIESANVQTPIQLEVGGVWQGLQKITVTN